MVDKQKLRKPIKFCTTFAIYTATHIIGEGGAGRIYEAIDDVESVWAIKLLHPTNVTRQKVKRFKNELQFCNKNKHPHIVTIHDHGIFPKDKDMLPFYVMPLYAGSLRGLLKSVIPTDKALPYFSQILDGVEAAHIQGIIHRDLKPENILHDTQGDRLIIADFGIARFEEDELYTAVETKDSEKLANFQYAAPEQRTRGSESDHRADVYALGLILNEMFTGYVPYGTGYKTIAKVAPQYEYLDEIVEKMIRQSPQDRIASVEAIKDQLIGRKNEYVTRQKISSLKNTVIPVTELDDPLVIDPIRLVNIDWESNRLTLFFQQPVNNTWVWALHNMGSHTSLWDKGPAAFSVSGNKAVITARENEVEDIINYFQGWLPAVNRVYKERVQREKDEEEERRRMDLQQQISAQEARQRVLNKIKI